MPRVIETLIPLRPSPRLLYLTELGAQMRATLPPVLRNSDDYLAVVHACAREVELIEAAIESVRAQFNPATADSLLNAWEAQLKLPVGGPLGATVEQRRGLVLSRLQKVLSGGTGSGWEQSVSAIVGPGWSYIEGGAVLPVSNQAPNPSGEHDATGATPAGWLAPTGPGVTTVWQTQTGWSAVGTKAFRLTATGVTVGGKQLVPLAAVPCAPGQRVSARAVFQLIAHRSVIQLEYLNAANAVIFTTWPTGATSGTLSLLDSLAPAGTASVRLSCGFFNEGPATGTIDGYFDAVQLLVSDTTHALGVYTDGDSPGFEWRGTPGNSASAPASLPAGVIQVTVPFAAGSSEFVQAEQQIRDLTDAHLELQILSSAVFLLDSSDMDVGEFGA